MADYVYGVTKVNGAAASEQTLTQGLDFWSITTTVNILTAGTSGGSAGSQAALNKLIEIVSLNGQPVILNAPTVSSGTYTFSFAVEHPSSWNAGTYLSGAVPPASGAQTLCNAIQVAGVNYGFSTDSALAAALTSELLTSATD